MKAITLIILISLFLISCSTDSEKLSSENHIQLILSDINDDIPSEKFVEKYFKMELKPEHMEFIQGIMDAINNCMSDQTMNINPWTEENGEFYNIHMDYYPIDEGVLLTSEKTGCQVIPIGLDQGQIVVFGAINKGQNLIYPIAFY